MSNKFYMWHQYWDNVEIIELDNCKSWEEVPDALKKLFLKREGVTSHNPEVFEIVNSKHVDCSKIIDEIQEIKEKERKEKEKKRDLEQIKNLKKKWEIVND